MGHCECHANWDCGVRPPVDGYGFVIPSADDWRTAPDDDWDTEMLVRSELAGAVHVGRRTIDGRRHNVWRLADGRAVAQLD